MVSPHRIFSARGGLQVADLKGLTPPEVTARVTSFLKAVSGRALTFDESCTLINLLQHASFYLVDANLYVGLLALVEAAVPSKSANIPVNALSALVRLGVFEAIAHSLCALSLPQVSAIPRALHILCLVCQYKELGSVAALSPTAPHSVCTMLDVVEPKLQHRAYGGALRNLAILRELFTAGGKKANKDATRKKTAAIVAQPLHVPKQSLQGVPVRGVVASGLSEDSLSSDEDSASYASDTDFDTSDADDVAVPLAATTRLAAKAAAAAPISDEPSIATLDKLEKVNACPR